MRIAMIGTKGVPAAFGGIEKYIEEVGQRLVRKGHRVTVFSSKWYCKNYSGNDYLGMEVARVPTLHHQATDALSNALFSALRIIGSDFDIAHFHGYASYYFVPVLRLLGKKTVITSHGLVDMDWTNPKYGGFGREIIRYGGMTGIRTAHSVSTVAKFWKKRIFEEYGRESRVFPSGLDQAHPRRATIIREKYGLCGNDFVLFLGRIDPIKRIDLLLSCADSMTKTVKLVIAGGAQDTSTMDYYQSLKSRYGSNPKIVFTGPVQGVEKEELLSCCRAFVTPSGSEGLPIAVLEAMSYGKCVLASDIPAHCEVIEPGKTGFLFSSCSRNDLQRCLKELVDKDDESLKTIGEAARLNASGLYDWDRTTDRIEENYRRLLQ